MVAVGSGMMPLEHHRLAGLGSRGQDRASGVPSVASLPAPTPAVRLHWIMQSQTIGILVHATGSTGVLHQLSGAIARHHGDIASVEILDNRPSQARTYFEVVLPGPPEPLIEDLTSLPIVRRVEIVRTLEAIYGKRIIIMGGGAQVGQVAIGAVSEADRHNIRGEHISVDTIPLVGEQKLAEAVRAVPRLPRAKALVLAGALMGGEIETAVREVRQQGLVVISLNMAGSVPDAADLVVTDPVQAGVMAVMNVADTAKFNIERLKRRVF
jgi:energy-converting hydrogenase B subunit Q